jgi:hypothetical protein
MSDKKKFIIEANYNTTVWFEVEAKDLKTAKMKITKGLNKGKSLHTIAKEIDWAREDLIDYDIKEGDE